MVPGGLGRSRPLLRDLAAGLGGVGGPSPASHPHPSRPAPAVVAQGSRLSTPSWSQLCRKQARWVEQGGGQGAAGGCSLTVSAACPGLCNPPPRQDRSLGHVGLGSLSSGSTDTWQPLDAATPHGRHLTPNGPGGLASDPKPSADYRGPEREHS